MKKRMIVISLIIGIFLINLISASFVLGNKSSEIITTYASEEPIKGWINISFQSESADSLLTGFDSSIKLIGFLDKNNINCESSPVCSCFPSNCEKGYSTSNPPQSSKTFSLDYNREKLIGLRVTSKIGSITEFRFNVSTNAGKSCTNPLKIDLLDDSTDGDSIEWKSINMSDLFECTIPNSQGCFKASDSAEKTEIKTANLYCEKIKIPVNKKLRIGANVIGTGNAQFRMSIDASESKDCTVFMNTSGKAKCEIIFDEELSESEQATVCITKVSGTTKYEIRYQDVGCLEDNQTECCGYSEFDEPPYLHDFDIFVEVAKYNDVDDFQFNQQTVYGDAGSDLAYYIKDYIDSRYTTCNPECIIPIRIYSGINQDISISDLYLSYDDDSGISKDTSSIYDIQSSDVLISSNFSKLDLEKANLLTPSSYGDKTLVLKLNDDEILEKKVSVKNIPKIISIIPQEVPAFVSYPFMVFLDEDASNLTYTWNFGDNTGKQVTNSKITEHTYSKLGNYTLTVSLSNKLGNYSKSISVIVISPKDYINSTIKDYTTRLNKIEAEINKTPLWIQKEILKEFDVDNIRSQIKTQKNKYDDSSYNTDEDYVKIMEALAALDIPLFFNLSQKITPSNTFPDPNQINLAALNYFGAGSVDGTNEDYSNAVTNWFMNAIQMTIESKTYALYYKNETRDLFSYAKVTLTPKPDQLLGEVYFLVNGDPDRIKFNTDKTVKSYDDAVAIIFSELTSQETIEFLYPGKISVGSFPVCISPEFRNLEIQVEPGICNFNKKCEKDLMEDYTNCRSDCKPVGLTVLWICILLFIALCI
ncbi:MAG: PKD domain-containing protein, partial [Candidatus Nanoarchaeia archaeon]|nr:PKD domain-containing protein [Candidatus Nanoarchaeia archaeon]